MAESETVDLPHVLSLLENYGRHHQWCEFLTDAEAPCDCGFAASLKRVQQQVFPRTYGEPEEAST